MIPNLSTFKSAPVGTAWKAAAMRGYVKKLAPTANVPSGTTYDAGVFDLVFVQADGDQWVYRYFPTAASKVGHGEADSATGPFAYIGMVEKTDAPSGTTQVSAAPAGYASGSLGDLASFQPEQTSVSTATLLDKDLLGWILGPDSWVAGDPDEFERARRASANQRLW